jgi:superfamily II DNA or RNA helicase
LWSLYGKFGPVLYEKPSVELRDEKFLTNVEVTILGVTYNTRVEQKTDSKYRDELEFIFTNPQRNDLLYKLCNKLNNNTLILVNQIAHGEALYEVLSQNTDKAVFFISGSMDVDERDKIKAIMESTNNVVCIAISAIFSTGVNIKNIHNIIFASGGKSFIRTVQSIGRGLRLHENKTLLNIFDIRDELEYGRQHSDKRKEIYKKEFIRYSQKNIKLA